VWKEASGAVRGARRSEVGRGMRTGVSDAFAMHRSGVRFPLVLEQNLRPPEAVARSMVHKVFGKTRTSSRSARRLRRLTWRRDFVTVSLSSIRGRAH
jgi:hypothetical protein